MNHNYTLNCAIRDFTIDDLAEGMEEALANPEPIVIDGDADDSKDDNGVVIIYKEKVIDTDPEIVLDDSLGDLISTNCNCREFIWNYFTCEHIRKLMCEFFIERDGVDSLKGSRIEKELIKSTGINTPFVPGILRKTDSIIKNFVDRNIKNAPKELPVWLEEKNLGDKSLKEKSKKNELLGIECVLEQYGEYDRVAISLKCGAKKKYVVKNIRALIESYADNSFYQFTPSTSFQAGRMFYDAQSQKVMDLLLSIYKDAERKGNVREAFASSYYSKEVRDMWIEGSFLDSLMEIIDGWTINCPCQNDGKEHCRVDLSNKPLSVSITGQEFGINLSINPFIVLGNGRKYTYIVEDNIVKRADISNWKDYKELSKLSQAGHDMYVRNSDIEGICQILGELPIDNEQLVSNNFELALIHPEKPSIKIYLDYPQKNFVTCQIKAVYPDNNNEYLIFDQEKDGKIRNTEEEKKVAALIWPCFDAYDPDNKEMVLTCDDNSLFSFLVDIVPSFSEYGEVFISDKLKKLKVRSAGDFSVGVKVDAGNLTMSLGASNLSKSEMIEILSTYNSKKKFTRLKNGEFITFDQEKADFYELIVEQYKNYGKKDPEAFKVPLFRAMYLNECFKKHEEIVFSENDEYKELIARVNDEDRRDYIPPKSLSDILRPYQLEGFKWLKMLKSNGFGGILADDMGLGKTLQVLSFVLSEYEEGKRGKDIVTLIVSPASLVYNWQREISLFTPQLKCVAIVGSAADRRKLIEGIGRDGDDTVIYVTSYDLLKRDLDCYEDIYFANQVIDESQFIKNQNTNAARGVKIINAGFRVALTGTPIENRLSDMWSIFDFLMPGFLYSYNKFREEFETPIVIDKDEEVMNRLQTMIHPFILRRLKRDVLKELPDKVEELVSVRLEGEQRKLYDAYAERLRLYLEDKSDSDFNESKIEILAELTKLRQICCGPELILDKYKGSNAKMDTCMELALQAIDAGHKLLIFSQFTSVLDELGAGLKKNKIAYHRIDGSVSKEKRMKLVTSFEEDDVPVFIISLKAGGTGLNLTAADIVIHYDPWWNIAAQNQATDRAHRIGQTNSVTVYQLVAEKTIEEQIVNLQNTKAKLAEDVLSGEGISSILINKKDLLALL